MDRQGRKPKRAHDVARLLAEKYCLGLSWGAALDIERIYNGVPLDYVIGWVPFLGSNIDLSLRPFIPRPETEFWTKKAVETLRTVKQKRPLRILDIFAGSGCIGIAILRAVPKSGVTFAEKNRRFIEEIRINLRRNGIKPARVLVVQSDIFKKIRGRFDAILANPPYVGVLSRLDKNVRRFEPKEAYWGGKDGFGVIDVFLKEARNHLLPGGTIWMEHGAWQKEPIRKLLKKFGYSRFSFHRDQYGRPRFAVIVNVPRQRHQ